MTISSGTVDVEAWDAWVETAVLWSGGNHRLFVIPVIFRYYCCGLILTDFVNSD